MWWLNEITFLNVLGGFSRNNDEYGDVLGGYGKDSLRI